MPFELPQLPYDYAALEPTIDKQTMTLHHDKHHATYVTNLNNALQKYPDWFQRSPEEIVSHLNDVPEDIRTTVRNNAGGHVNHSMFWQIMAPQAGGDPTGAIAGAISEQFGGFSGLQEKFNDAGAKQFGSGWVWLARAGDGKLQVLSTPNQDNPLMQGLYPVLGNDVWEHAYYIKYQNKRADYLKAWWAVVNWQEVNKRFEQSLAALKTIRAKAA